MTDTPTPLEILRSVANGETEHEWVVFEDITGARSLSPDWESALCEAIQWTDIVDPELFLHACCQTLLNVRAKCDALSGAISRLILAEPSFETLYMGGQLLQQQRDLTDTTVLTTAAGAAFSRLGPIRRWLYLKDPRVKALWHATYH